MILFRTLILLFIFSFTKGKAQEVYAACSDSIIWSGIEYFSLYPSPQFTAGSLTSIMGTATNVRRRGDYQPGNSDDRWLFDLGSVQNPNQKNAFEISIDHLGNIYLSTENSPRYNGTYNIVYYDANLSDSVVIKVIIEDCPTKKIINENCDSILSNYETNRYIETNTITELGTTASNWIQNGPENYEFTLTDLFSYNNNRFSLSKGSQNELILKTINSPNSFTQAGTYRLSYKTNSGDTVSLVIKMLNCKQVKDSCYYLIVSNTTPFLRRCFNNTYYVSYRNDGLAPANNAYIDIELDANMTFINGSIPSIDLGNGIRRFNLGTLAGETRGQFNYTVYLACGDSTILGQTHCVTAHIYPDSACIPIPDYANLQVTGRCLGDSIRFQVQNVGTTSMIQSIIGHMTEDEILQAVVPIAPLNPNQSFFRTIPINQTSTYRLEVANPMMNAPFGRLWGATIASSTLEGCGAGTSFNTGYVTRFSTPDDQPWLDIDCQQNGGSYDPNDKTGYPLGITNNNYIMSNDAIEYKIRFQNTGTDTAFTVVIRDTLDAHLDPSTIQFGASSHPYTAQLFGAGVLKFTFNTINLVDSFTNEPASHGFVAFKIWQKPNNPEGTVIHNKASIYFDFNPPIVTNTTTHVISNQNRASFIVSIQEPNLEQYLQTSVIPNPFEQSATLILGTEDLEEFTLKIYTLSGQCLSTQNYHNTHQALLKRENLEQGMYLFHVETKGKVITQGKIVVQ